MAWGYRSDEKSVKLGAVLGRSKNPPPMTTVGSEGTSKQRVRSRGHGYGQSGIDTKQFAKWTSTKVWKERKRRFDMLTPPIEMRLDPSRSLPTDEWTADLVGSQTIRATQWDGVGGKRHRDLMDDSSKTLICASTARGSEKKKNRFEQAFRIQQK
ncbi:hypothetical protein OG21DRAFT_1506183 [Imleria badia]|nr:hypothetical protein OG21DRAFT_1506183 [Imleria badia]